MDTLSLTKEAKIKWRKDNLFNKCAGKTGQPLVKE